MFGISWMARFMVACLVSPRRWFVVVPAAFFLYIAGGRLVDAAPPMKASSARLAGARAASVRGRP